ncbi:MAG: hypothetical protein PHQ57_00795 [Candidatus Omnitrophica bacterium]|nr:hypothetical protein [Candidatus Omnitrophota bacterium]
MNKKGLSILEVLISALLLALVITGLANIFVAAKRYIFHSRARVTAVERIKSCLEPLQMQVDQSRFVVDPMDPGLWSWNPAIFGAWMDSSTVTLYTPGYTILPMDLDLDPNARTSEINRVDLRIDWDERTAQ